MENRLIFLYPTDCAKVPEGGRRREGARQVMVYLVQARRRNVRQIRRSLLRGVIGSRASDEGTGPRLPRKASLEVICRTVPQTDTGRREEDSKAHERTLAKELGKLAP